MSRADRVYAAFEHALRDTFGFAAFRPFQETTLRALAEGRDVYAVSPTGSGKSVLFCVPSLVFPGLTVVVSPLLSLMMDQVGKLRGMGVAAARLTTDAPDSEVRAFLREPHEYNIVYLSPERLKAKDVRAALRGTKVSMICWDEAHLGDRWSSFRSAWTVIGDFVSEHPEAIRLACTATSDDDVDHTVHRIMGLRNPLRVVSSAWRDNIAWKIAKNVDEDGLADLVAEFQERPGRQVVYVSSRNAAETIASHLQGAGLSAAYYHAGMQQVLRESTQEDFMSSRTRCIVATSAFGMGVDAPDIRLVAQYQLPASLFDLAQMIGRAGRDGEPAVGWVNTGAAAEKTQRFLLEVSNPPSYVYTRLWDKFAAQQGPQKWSTPFLARAAGIGKEAFFGQALTALSLFEYYGGISLAPGGLIYTLPIANMARAQAAIRGVSGARIVQNTVIYEVPPDGPDRSRSLIGNGCYAAPPAECRVVTRVADVNPITPEMVGLRRTKAENALEAVREFCWADNKREFFDRYFTQA